MHSVNQPDDVLQSTDQERMQIQEMVQDYLNQSEIQKRVRNILGRQNRFNVNMDELRQFNPKLSKFIVQDPIQAIRMFQDQLNTTIKGMQDEAGAKVNNEKMRMAQGNNNFPSKVQIYYVNFEGNFGKNHVTPRGLKAELVNQYVAVNGIVTRMSIVKPKIQTSVHYCEATKRGLIKTYNDQFNLNQLADGDGSVTEQTNAFPTKDSNDNPLSAEYGYCIYKDSQIITIQEMPERAPTGQLPRSIQVVLENDLVDKVKPGDRIQVTGVFRTVPPHGTQTSGIFRTFLVATGVTSLNAEKEKPNLNENDIKNIKKLAKDKEVFKILGNSVASSIEGNDHVKRALLLQLLGGVEKNLENGTHLRGDINIMMVGDPSTAKSQLLRHVMDIAPLAINTTGRGSSGVGLTAAVTIDKDTGEKHLEAGAMVLADRGIVCIDEFDKMNDQDRVAIHEVMEQQTVTIAKAGMHVSLNARCSVIAAANPIYGDYARDQPVGKNIGLPDSLLSRFDLLFIMLDEKDPESDRRIAERVIMNHRYQATNNEQPLFNYFNEDVVIEPDYVEERKDGKNNSIFEKQGKSHGKKESSQIVTREFLKKYISYSKSQKSPELHPDCIEYAAQFYSGLRTKALNFDANKVSVPITVRTLETLIRLSSAHAKLRLSKLVETIDIDVAAQILHNSIFQEDLKSIKEEDNEDEDEEVVQVNTNSRSKRNNARGDPVMQSPEKKVKREEKTPVKSTAKKAMPDSEGRPSKRMKIDHNEEVSELFQQPKKSKVKVEKVDMQSMKMVYKMITETKDAMNKVSLDKLMKRYKEISELDTSKKAKVIIQNKNHLIQIIEELENDNLVMYSPDDGNVVLV